MAIIQAGIFINTVEKDISALQQNVVVDSFEKNLIKAIKWIVNTEAKTTGKVLTSEIVSVYKSSNDDIFFNEYSITGNEIDYVITFSIVGNNFNFVFSISMG